jgi:hypothetical protein
MSWRPYPALVRTPHTRENEHAKSPDRVQGHARQRAEEANWIGLPSETHRRPNEDREDRAEERETEHTKISRLAQERCRQCDCRRRMEYRPLMGDFGERIESLSYAQS